MKNMIDYKQFNGNAYELKEVMQFSWDSDYSESKESYFQYTEEYISWRLHCPNKAPNLQMAAYSNNSLIGFLGCFPHRTRIDENEYQSALWSFLTCLPEFRGRRVTQRMVEKHFLEMYKANIEILYAYFDNNHIASKISDLLEKKEIMPHRIQQIFFSFYIKPLDAQAISQCEWLSMPEDLMLKGVTLFKKKKAHHIQPLESCQFNKILPIVNTNNRNDHLASH